MSISRYLSGTPYGVLKKKISKMHVTPFWLMGLRQKSLALTEEECQLPILCWSKKEILGKKVLELIEATDFV
jgi:hypothetical protein